MASNPLQQFEIQKIVDLSLAGYDISLTNHSLWTMLAVSVTTLLMFVASRKLSMVPHRAQSLVELTVGFISNLTQETAGKNAAKFVPVIATIFLFIASVNLFGMIPGSYTGTSQMFTTGMLAVGVFAMVIITGFYTQGLGFLKLFYPDGTPWWLAPLIVLLEVISFFARPVTLALRLGANMMAGHILLKVFATFVVMLLAALPPLLILPLAMTIALTGLEIGVALLQAYIFTILTCVYLHDALYGH
mgnify:CR=1 FL=1